MKNKMNKSIVPEGFNMAMVISDILPVVFFGASSYVMGLITRNYLVYLGAAISFLSGLFKVIWKFIIVKKKKNIWLLFIQMRIFMPIGFLIVLSGLFRGLSSYSFADIFLNICRFPQALFFILGIIGMFLMIVFSMKLDSSDAKSNWIEQTVNGFAQAFFFIGLLIIYLN